MTFSIVATDGAAYGVAVASKFLAVGAVVPGARHGVGAVATQSFAKVSYIADLLDALSDGESAGAALARLTAADERREERQVGVVGPTDEATYTGSECTTWAGGVTGRSGATAYAIQGNVLTGPDVVRSMERAWVAADGEPFTRRLVTALLAGDAAGGDRRGRQSAALYAVRAGAGYDASGVLADLRVDDHAEAPAELARLVDLAELYFGGPEDVQPLAGPLADEVRTRLASLGRHRASLAEDLADWAGEVNLEMRLSRDGIDRRVLEELRRSTTA